jgi:hypothetical protein
MDSNFWSPSRMGARLGWPNDAESNVARLGTAAFLGEGLRVRIHLPPPKSQRTFSPLQLNGPGRGAHRGIGRTIQGHDQLNHTS